MELDVLDSIFLHIFQSSLMASVLILLVLSIKKIFNHRLGARFHHVLWILVLIRLLMPVSVASPFSIFNLFDERIQQFSNPQTISAISNVFSFTYEYFNKRQPIWNEKEVDEQADESRLSHNSRPSTEDSIDKAVKTEASSYPFILKVLSRIWWDGVLFLMLLSCVATIKFKRRTKVFKRVTDAGIQSLVEQCCQKLKIKKSIPVYMDSYFKGPCISGVTHASIYLPADFSSRISQNELKHILLHELAHHKRKDLFCNFLVTMAALMHWFNPLVWFAAKKMRCDREIACDAYVMEILGEGERVSYGTTIIHLAKSFNNSRKQLSLASFYETSSQLERRITMIKMFKKGSYKVSAIAIICCMVIGVVMLTNAVGAGGEKNNNISKVKDKLVIIDPGHGGDDPGAVYSLTDTDTDAAQIKEKDLNLEISLMLYNLLKESGIRVELTRSEDLNLELADRVEMANSLDASLFVSIHNNAAPDSSENGTMTMFNPSKNDAAYGIAGERVAQLLQEEMIGELKTADAGIQEVNNIRVLRDTKMPSVIAQVAYITSESDRQKLMNEEFKTKAAQALHDGVIKVLYEMQDKA